MFKKILVPYDLSEPSKRALDWAVQIGLTDHTELTVVHVISQDARLTAYGLVPNRDEMVEHIRKEIDKDIRHFSSQKGSALASVDIRIEWGDPVPCILESVEEIAPNLIVLGTHGHTGLKHILLGSVAEKIIRHAKAPVLVARESSQWPPQKILLPVDNLEYMEDSLLMASHWMQFGTPKVELLHVVSFPDMVFYTPYFPKDTHADTLRKMEKDALDWLKELSAKHPSLAADVKVVTGPEVEEICRRSKEMDSDLIILPTHGREGLSHFFLGSITEQIIRYSSCSVLSFCPEKG